jgi:hypothetical protein
MARYNTVSTTSSVSAAGTITTPTSGLFTKLTGTAPYAVTIPDPTLYPGVAQTFYNATSGVVTLTSPSGVFTPTVSASTALSAGNSIVIISDGTNYISIIGSNNSMTTTTIVTTYGTITNTATANTDVANKFYVDSKTRVTALGLYYGS